MSKPRRPRVAAKEIPRADTTGLSVTVLQGKARAYALKEFFTEAVPAARGEKVVKQSGLPADLDLLP